MPARSAFPPEPAGPNRPIVTPEAVPLSLETATVGSRGVAYVLDLAIILLGLLVVGIAQFALGAGGFVPGWLGIALLLVLAFALQFGYPIGFETLRRGQTPGKSVMGLRVVTVEGAPIGLRHAAIRATVALFELLGTFGLVAVVTSFVSQRGQRLGDMAAGTLVVRERRFRGGLHAQHFDPPVGLEAYTGQLDVSGLGPSDYATVRDALRRLPSLREQTRTRIASQVADPLRARVAPPPPPGVSAEAWLQCLAAAVQARRSPPPGGDGGASEPDGRDPAPPPIPSSTGDDQGTTQGDSERGFAPPS